MNKKDYDLLYQVAKELQMDWIVDAWGEQLPFDARESLAEMMIKERMEELRSK